MKHTNKKGFTIVELVIVIAVIAILAAVLIPTFSNLIKKANISNDTAIAKNLNTAISVAGVLDGVETFEDAIAAVREQGFLLANLNAKTDGCYFVWEAESKQFLLVDTKADFKVLYSANKDYAPIGASWNIITSDLTAAGELEQLGKGITVKRTVRAAEDLNTLINSGEEVLVYVDESVQISDKSFVKLNKEGAVVTVDFGNAAVQGGSANADLEAFPIYVEAGTMNIKNGTIGAAAAFIDADGIKRSGALSVENATANIDGTKFENNIENAINTSFEGATGTIKNATFNVYNTAVGVYAGSNVRLENCTMNLNWEGVFASNNGGQSFATIVSGNYHATTSNLLAIYGGVITVEGGTFTCDNANKLFKIYSPAGGKIIIKGGSFNGIAFADLTADLIQGMINPTSATNYTITQVDGAWVISVN